MLPNFRGGGSRLLKERKVSVVFRHSEEDKHCAGVESLLLPAVPNHKLLFTASRDSTVKRWDVAGPEPVLEASFEGHADWVNDLALIGDLLITCSNDQTVRLWKAGSDNGQHLHTLSYHTDYVTCLAAAPQRSLVVSAGLRAEIFMLNIETGKHQQLYPRVPQPAAPTSPAAGVAGAAPASLVDSDPHGGVAGGGSAHGHPAVPEPPSGHPGSVYALALNPSGTLIAAGTSEALIRLLDPRSGKKIAKLRGHHDTVRALQVNAAGTSLLSGASDGTIRLWDVGMQRCVQTYKVHGDSVWTLLSPDDTFSTIYSAGRDRAIYRTDTHSRTSELLAVEEGGVRALALDPEDGEGSTGTNVGIWAATPSSNVNKWLVPREAAAPDGDGRRSFSVARRSQGPLGSARHRQSLEANRQPVTRHPAVTIPGVPGIIAHEVLTDRRHVLTQDARGHVALWDVLAGAPVVQYGKVDLEAKRRELWEPRSVAPWFSADNRLGCLSISLEPPGAFAAEEYASALEYAGVADDCKVNYGKMVLECAFAMWRHRLAQSLSGAAAGGGGGGGGGADGHGGEGDACPFPEMWPKFWQGRALPAVMCSRHDGQRWRRLMDAFDGTEAEPSEIPTWVADVVLRNANVTPKEAKCAFILMPAEGSNLPSLMQSKLNAPRILQVHKVAHYCCSKLQEQGIQLEVRPVYLRRPPNAPPDPPPDPAGAPPRPVLELVCNGMAAPYEMSLSSVKKYVWKKKNDDLVFHFRIKDPAVVVPLPVLGPSNS
ncbi:hypothetical protein HYH03_016211 [Edaphochlamys debaryana]|uniref:Uncharacterized protein n=1 Tax=Edaphochlamys debaryana TaxID=47281 RepID=A0A836BRU3_9CHLO|nr:hypothetical protein HYH03_016211 [Edaphochlamys debaryana]|eukprot:KAG2485008.1 hypothetical protein HYH03_016211 [Edaphochlamys debaryana]